MRSRLSLGLPMCLSIVTGLLVTIDTLPKAAAAAVAATKPSPVVAPAKSGKATKASGKKVTPATKPDSGPPGEAAPPSGPATPPADASPTADLKKNNASLRKVLARQRPNWSPEAEVRNAELRKIVGGFLDFEELAHRALARHWDGLAVKQRADFVATLRDLVERSYVKQVYGQPDYDVKFDKETVTGSEAAVTATLETTAKGKKVSVALEYKLLWKGRWLVFDVVTDEQSLLETYRAEFNKIITKESFDGLLKRMKKKLEEKT